MRRDNQIFEDNSTVKSQCKALYPMSVRCYYITNALYYLHHALYSCHKFVDYFVVAGAYFINYTGVHVIFQQQSAY